LRKFIISLLGVVAVVGITASIATASHGRAHSAASGALCGTLYKPPCAPPGAVFSSLAACTAKASVTISNIRLHAIAGIRKATIAVNGHTVKTVTYTNRPQNKTIGVTISTRGLKPGLYKVTVKVTDVRGVTRSHTGHFAICKPKPVVTG